MDTSPGHGPPEDEGGADGASEPVTDATGAGQPGADSAHSTDGNHSTEATEAGQPAVDGPGPPTAEVDPTEGKDPLRFNRWMKRSATGAIMTGISIGLREALQPAVKEPAFMIEASGQPEDPDNPIELHFDPDNPADTVAIIRQPSPDGHADGPPPAE